jgi:hypothetical protein
MLAVSFFTSFFLQVSHKNVIRNKKHKSALKQFDSAFPISSQLISLFKRKWQESILCPLKGVKANYEVDLSQLRQGVARPSFIKYIL